MTGQDRTPSAVVEAGAAALARLVDEAHGIVAVARDALRVIAELRQEVALLRAVLEAEREEARARRRADQAEARMVRQQNARGRAGSVSAEAEHDEAVEQFNAARERAAKARLALARWEEGNG